MNNNLVVANIFQKWINDPNTRLPITLGKILTPIIDETDTLTVIHPTPIDPVIVSKKLGTIALWFKF